MTILPYQCDLCAEPPIPQSTSTVPSPRTPRKLCGNCAAKILSTRLPSCASAEIAKRVKKLETAQLIEKAQGAVTAATFTLSLLPTHVKGAPPKKIESPDPDPGPVIFQAQQFLITDFSKIFYVGNSLKDYHLKTLRMIDKNLHDEIGEFLFRETRNLFWELPLNIIHELNWPVSTISINSILHLRGHLEWYNIAGYQKFIAKHAYFFNPSHDSPSLSMRLAKSLSGYREKKKPDPSWYTIAYCFEFGIGMKRDLRQALKIYSRLGRKLNHEPSKIKYALIKCATDPLSTSIKRLKKILVKHDDAVVHYKLGQLLLQQPSTTAKKDKAFEHLKKSSESGFTGADELRKKFEEAPPCIAPK